MNPAEGQMTFLRNADTSATYNLPFKADKKDRLYFCVSLNYNEDSVSIVEWEWYLENCLFHLDYVSMDGSLHDC